MAIKNLNTRLKLKYDTYANWTLDTEATQLAKTNANLVLLEGELGICALDNKEQGAQTAPTVLFKVGNGTTSFKDLKWASALAADVYDWAKKSEDEFKTWLNETAKFATDEELAAAIEDVSADVSALDTRITEIEGALGLESGSENSVSARLDAAEDAIETLNGDENTDGSVAKALKDAKAYANGLASNYDAAGSASTAEANAKSYVDGKVSELNADIEANATGITEAKALAENKANAAKSEAIAYVEEYTLSKDQLAAAYEIRGSAAIALNDAKKYTDEKVAAQADKDAAQDALIAGLRTDVDAGAAKIETLVGDVEGDDEKSVREIAAEETAKIVAGADEKYDTLKEIADFIMGDETGAAKMANDIAANAEAIADLEKEFDTSADSVGRVTVAEKAIDAVEADLAAYKGQITDALAGKETAGAAATAESNAKAYAKEYADGLASNYDASGAAAQALVDAKKYADDEDAKLDAEDQRLAGLISDIDTAVKAAQGDATKALADAKAADDKAVAAQTAANTADGKAVKAQEEVDALETVVEGVKSTANTATANIESLSTRVKTIEDDYLMAIDELIFDCGTASTVLHIKQ